MQRRIILALALIAVLAAAATIRPPRASPARSYLSDGQDVQVPRSPPRAASRGSANHHHPRKSKAHSKRQLPPPIDLNRATPSDLARIPGVSAWLAERIIAYRELVGPFESLDDLSDLDGISASRLASLGRYVVVR